MPPRRICIRVRLQSDPCLETQSVAEWFGGLVQSYDQSSRDRLVLRPPRRVGVLPNCLCQTRDSFIIQDILSNCAWSSKCFGASLDFPNKVNRCSLLFLGLFSNPVVFLRRLRLLRPFRKDMTSLSKPMQIGNKTLQFLQALLASLCRLAENSATYEWRVVLFC